MVGMTRRNLLKHFYSRSGVEGGLDEGTDAAFVRCRSPHVDERHGGERGANSGLRPASELFGDAQAGWGLPSSSPLQKAEYQEFKELIQNELGKKMKAEIANALKRKQMVAGEHKGDD